jgi:hypothetical protein
MKISYSPFACHLANEKCPRNVNESSIDVFSSVTREETRIGNVEISRMIQKRKKKSRTPLRCVRDCCIVVKYRVSSETNAVETVENPTKSDARTFRKKEDHVHTLHACVVPSVSNVIIPRFLNTQRNQEGKEEEEKRRRRFCSRRRTYRNVLDVIHTRAS